jgi:hypothetical protein
MVLGDELAAALVIVLATALNFDLFAGMECSSKDFSNDCQQRVRPGRARAIRMRPAGYGTGSADRNILAREARTGQ